MKNGTLNLNKFIKLLSLSVLILAVSACSQETMSSNQESSNQKSSSSEISKNTKLFITVEGEKLEATIVDNSSTKALVEKLSAGAITYEAHDYGNFEKVGDLPWKLPQNDEEITTKPGDLILYQGKSFVIYYDTNQWNFTRLGRIENVSQSQLKSILKANKGNVKITLSLE